MTDSSLYRTILVGTGGASHSEVALARAVTLARHHRHDVQRGPVVPQVGRPLMTAAAAFPGAEPFEAQAMTDEHASRQAYLTQVAGELRAQGVSVTEHLRPALKPADAILEVAQETGADLIVLGRKHKSAWSAALAGSVADMVSHASPVDVLIAR